MLTACSDGRVLCYDLRGGSGTESMLAGGKEANFILLLLEVDSILLQFDIIYTLAPGCSHAFHAVQFNPVQPNLVATSNDKV